MDELIAYLHNIYPLTPELVIQLKKIIKYRKVKRWEYLLIPPAISKEIYFVAKGLFRGYYVKKNKKEVSAWVMAEGKLICSIPSFYEQLPSFEYICAIEESEVFYINYDELQNIYKNYMEFNFVGRELITKYLIAWAWQLFNIRMMSAPERYSWLLENSPEVIERVPSTFLCSYLGVTESTLSKVRSAQASRVKSKKGDR